MAKERHPSAQRNRAADGHVETGLSEVRPPLPTMLSPQQAADYWGVEKDKVYGWIRAGRLRAIDVRSVDSSRPRYRIPSEAIQAFNAAHCNVAWPGERTEESRRGRATRPSPKIEYF